MVCPNPDKGFICRKQKVMKINLSATYFITATWLLLSSCSFHTKKEPLCVIYRVRGYSHSSVQLSISYKTDTGTVFIDTLARSWSKKICLSPGKSALLTARLVYTPMMYSHDLMNGQIYSDQSPTVVAKIIHEKKTVTDSSTLIALASLTPFEVEGGFQ